MPLDVWLEAGLWFCPQHAGPFLAQTRLPQSTGPNDATSIPLADALLEPIVRERLQHPHAHKALFCNDAETQHHPESWRTRKKHWGPAKEISHGEHPPAGPSAATSFYTLTPNLLSFSRATVWQKAVWILLNPDLPCHVQRSWHTASAIRTSIFCTWCVIQIPSRATGERCGHEVGITCWYFTFTNKTRETIAGMGCPADRWKNWFGSTATGSCSCRREVKTEKCSHKIPVYHSHLRQSSSIFPQE